MNGARGAGVRLAALLAGAVPARLPGIEVALGLPAGYLPVPATCTSVQPGELGIEDAPALITSVLSATVTDLEDLDTYGDPMDGPGGYGLAPGQLWSVVYRMRTEVFVVADDIETADVLRYAYALAVREVLLGNRDVPDVPVDVNDPTEGTVATIDGARPLITEAFDTVTTADSRAWSQALLDYPLTVAEPLAGAPGVPVDSITTHATVVGLRDPLPGAPPRWHPSD